MINTAQDIQEREKEQIQIKDATSKMVDGQNSGSQRLLQQFVFVVRGNSKYNLLDPMDVSSFEKSMQKIQITNVFTFSTLSLLSGLAYWKFGGWAPSLKRPKLRILRHLSVLIIPGMLFSPMVSTTLQGGEIENLNRLAEKYKSQIFEPEFNRKLVNDMMQIKKNKHQEPQQQQQQQLQQQQE